MEKKKRALIGAHTSITGGIEQALIRAQAIGATTTQLFTSNQKQWKGRFPSQESLEKWKKALSETGMKGVMSHDSYLINLGSNKPELLEKSRRAFVEEINRCLTLDLTYMNFHPGSATGASEEECLNRIIESLLLVSPLLENQELRLLIETTAGQGSTVGHRFEHLSYLIEGVQDKLPIGICIDTCHIFAAGYDIRTPEAWEKTLETFEQQVGLEHLHAFHVNDSLHPLGSRKDRHANLGQGAIGLDAFKTLMSHPKMVAVPKYLETPNGDMMWREEIAMLREFSKD